MPGPANAIIGDDYGMDLPISQVEEQDLTAEKNAARFSKTKEYKILRDHLEARIAYYQNFLPGGTPILEVETTNLAVEWKVALAIIAEFKAIIAAYEQAKETVENAARRTNA
jgi:hypothetical protein